MKTDIADTELEFVDGAGWIDDAWEGTKRFVGKHKRAVIMAAGMAAGAALCATGLGAAAGVGLIHATAAEFVMAGLAGAEIGAAAGGCVAD